MIAGWLEENLPEGWGEPGFTLPPEERRAFNEEYQEARRAGRVWTSLPAPAKAEIEPQLPLRAPR